VKVLSVDAKAKRIALSIKQLTTPASRPSSRPVTVAAKPASMNDKLAALSMKWKGI
jgi:uncharacterized protein